MVGTARCAGRTSQRDVPTTGPSSAYANESRYRASAAACDIPLRRGWFGCVLLFLPAALRNDRRDFHICFAAWHTKARRGVAARICWLDFCWLGIGPVPARDRNGYLYSHCRPMPFPSQSLLLRAGRGLHRMSLHSFRNNSRSLHDCCSLARVRKDLIFDGATARLNMHDWTLSLTAEYCVACCLSSM